MEHQQAQVTLQVKNSEISSVGKKSAEIPGLGESLVDRKGRAQLLCKYEERGGGQCADGKRSLVLRKGQREKLQFEEKRHFISPPYEDE